MLSDIMIKYVSLLVHKSATRGSTVITNIEESEENVEPNKLRVFKPDASDTEELEVLYTFHNS
jgi:hypothetical protein